MNRIRLIFVGCIGVIVILAGASWFLKARDAKFPLLYNPGQHAVTETDLQKVQGMVAEKGERYLISIAVVNVNRIQALTGHGSFRPKSGRKYFVVRKDAGWVIESAEEWANEK